MKIKEIYELAVELGKDADPRGSALVEKELDRRREEYQKLTEDKKEEFDLLSLTNPYSDTRILYGDPEQEVEALLVGIDVDTSELLLADRLIEKGEKIDLIISHHPSGRALAGLYEVMALQADVLNKFGVPINVAEGILKKRIGEVMRRFMPFNHLRAVDCARLLNLSFMCIHTPTDNLVTNFLQKKMEQEKPERVGDVIKLLKGIPEYHHALRDKAGPKILSGAEENRVGQILVDMTGGTEGAKEAFEKLTQAGRVGTVIGMHFSEEHRREAERQHVNLIVAGHIASDNIGMNLFLDEVLRKEKLRIISCSGFVRVKR